MAFTTAGQRLGLSNPLTAPPIWIGFVVGAALLWAAFVYSPRASRVLNLGALIYAGLIGVMAGVAAGLAWHDRRFWPTALGGGLFLISDVMLGNRELRNHPWFLVHDVVWVIYIFGQALIVLTTAWA
ncbi:MAG TPA: lysoplasmalogenase family protein [Anaerolineae bacterium]|nr:lysoplasmalogenase family protein [Anaerolineae bacterium]